MNVGQGLVIAVVVAMVVHKIDEASQRDPFAGRNLVYTSTPENSVFRDTAGNAFASSRDEVGATPVALTAPTAPPPRDLRPADERRFTEIVASHMSRFNEASNDMTKGATRPARASALCAAMPSGQVKNWVGTVETLSSNSEGYGVLGVELADNVLLKTANNSFSDSMEKTLLQPGSTVFTAASGLSKGQQVRFSGSLLRTNTDCFMERSMTQRGSMTSPEFAFRFLDLQAVDAR